MTITNHQIKVEDFKNYATTHEIASSLGREPWKTIDMILEAKDRHVYFRVTSQNKSPVETISLAEAKEEHNINTKK